MSELNPITREEQFLAKAAGYDVEPPKPITRTEMFLQKISDRPGTGGGGDVDMGVTGATVGQTVTISAVDENGKPTEWEAVDFPESGGATTWEDLGSTFEEGVVLAECSPTFVDASVAGMNMFVFTEAFALVEGNEYTVNWNGTPFTCICSKMAMGTMTGLGLGNIGMLSGGADTGEPFVLGVFDQADATAPAAAVPLDGSTSLTISITGMTENIKPIPIKYFPKNGIVYSSDGILYKTADTSNPENRLLSTELKDMVEHGLAIYLCETDTDGIESLLVPNSIAFNIVPEWGGLTGYLSCITLNDDGVHVTIDTFALPTKNAI